VFLIETQTNTEKYMTDELVSGQANPMGAGSYLNYCVCVLSQQVIVNNAYNLSSLRADNSRK
jgi:hypothetical protein